ncbi:putative transposase for insertion sequence element [Oscillibacter valericigenes Sjm18-20]|nr:putative transposase for insertion sequence element [Oscillibacter valericigenes Sjm18-20]
MLSTAYKRPQTMKGGHEWWAYVYDEYYDCVICPEYLVLRYATTNREGYREYKSDPRVCAIVPPVTCAPMPGTVSRRCSGISGRITRMWRTTHVTRPNTKRCTPSEKRP